MSRILRIWPAFLIAIIVSALIAAYSSQLPLNEVIPSITKYITHNAKILTPIQYNMADAFSNNPFKNAVNGSLWTLPWEIRVYILTLILGFLGILSSRATANTFIFVGLIALYQIKRLGALPTGWDSESVIYMLACYLIGKFAATNRNCLGNTKILMAIFASYVLLRSFVPDSKVWCQILLISGAIYAIATHKFLAIKDTDIDLSYGVYIYSFPIQQLVAYLAPEITPTAMLLVAVPIILIAAAISWFIIEKPSMKLNCKIKKNLQKQEQPIATK
jgi:peptidoglycan/LPS O-acetylase OafA/YrhL